MTLTKITEITLHYQDGVIKDWFISNVQQHIENIYRELSAVAYGEMLLNYLGYKDEELASIDLKDGNMVLSIVEHRSEKFSNNLSALLQFTRPNMTSEVLKSWLSLPDYEAMELLANIFSFPYLGLDYREDVMANYYDVRQGFGKHLDDYEFDKSLPDIEQYQPIGFKERNKDLKTLDMSDTIFSLISYQNYVRRT